MKHFFFYSLFAVLAMLASCSEYDLGYTADQISFNVDFRKEFGIIDSHHDFNLAERVSVSVTPGKSNTVQFYSNESGKWTLVGDFHDVTTTQTLSLDVVKGTKELMVVNGSETQLVAPGTSVSFSGTRAGKNDFSNGDFSVELNEGQKYTYYYFDKVEATKVFNYLPHDVNNHGKTTQDFSMVSTGEFIVYTVFWEAVYGSEYGIYYYGDDNSPICIPLSGNAEYNDMLQYLDSNGNWVLRNEASANKSIMSTDPNNAQYRSKGVIVNLPVGTRFGFYLKSGLGRPGAITANGYQNIYSEKSLNDDQCYFGTYYDEKGDLVIGMEDLYYSHWKQWGFPDFDLNDKVIKIYGAQPIVLDSESTQSWLLPFEDLGGTHDWDYNDVILKLSYVSGQGVATITPLAAGGTLHSEVFFNDTDDESKAQDLGEIHLLLGADPVGEDELYEPINASSKSITGMSRTVQVNNPSTFTISSASSSVNSSTSGTLSQSITGVYIKTLGTNGVSTIAYNGIGKTPAMLVLPTSYEKDGMQKEWAWPTENTDIRSVYGVPGHSFAEWVVDHTKAQDWYMYPSGTNIIDTEETPIPNNTLSPSPEYNMSQFGTTISLPSKTGTEYIFNSNHFNDYSNGAVITVVLKGVQNNVLYAYDGTSKSSSLGSWSKLSYTGEWSVMGNNSCGSGSGSAKFEGMYQVSVSKEELELIKAKGSWVITSNNDMCILYLAIRSVNSEDQSDGPGSSNDPANGSEPVLAPIR